MASALSRVISALQGISSFSPPTAPGPVLSDEAVRDIRRAVGGALEPIPQVRLRWYPPDIERAQRAAQTGDLMLIGQLCESMNLDGVYRGLCDARTSVAHFPKRMFGREEIVKTLQRRTGSDRNVYDEMIPATEAKLMIRDGFTAGVGIGEMVPVEGRNFPVLIRRHVQNLIFLPQKNTWYYRSYAGLMPIQPGVPSEDGNTWVLHIPGGRLSPWNSGLWNTLGRSYINKTQTMFARQSYVMKHAHPARVINAPIGATQEERLSALRKLVTWCLNPVFALPLGWKLDLVESKGEGIKVYDDEINTYNSEMATALCGSAVMLQGTAGFSNMDVFRIVQKDLIESTSSGWDHTVNTQILPAWIASAWGEEALDEATTVETDISEPKDRKAEADTMMSLGNALKVLVEAVAAAQRAAQTKAPVAVNVQELLADYGIPTVAVTEIVTPPIEDSGASGASQLPEAGAPPLLPSGQVDGQNDDD